MKTIEEFGYEEERDGVEKWNKKIIVFISRYFFASILIWRSKKSFVNKMDYHVDSWKILPILFVISAIGKAFVDWRIDLFPRKTRTYSVVINTDICKCVTYDWQKKMPLWVSHCNVLLKVHTDTLISRFTL